MAPLRPSARDLRAQRIAGDLPSYAPAKTFRPSAATSDAFLSTKQDRRLIKRSSFVSRVTASNPRGGGGVSKKRSRGKGGANSTSASTSKSSSTYKSGSSADSMLEGLADALPELAADEAAAPDGRVQHRSLRSRKGALRRKERIVRGEMERFGASMARLAEARQQGQRSQRSQQGQQGAGEALRHTNANAKMDAGAGIGRNAAADADAGAEDAQRAGRWAALRGFISSTMKQNPAFEK
ncbi:hypothetical protein ESCO_004463 [Escovopsis weberi]|uniref:Ribosome biogenesis protein SLX9 n=1 Tax=Escovopsis weberi TaxID=150374 RepID=A0A0M9VVA1_ESCWE|nr:hypothetical protein ESCO_004463 [Escovopsis weberi]